MPKEDVVPEDDPFGAEVDTHQVQRLAEANQKAAETAAAKMVEEGDAEGEDLTDTAVEVQAEQLADTKAASDD